MYLRVHYAAWKREKWRALGLCASCGEPRDRRFLNCARCREFRRDQVRLYRSARCS